MTSVGVRELRQRASELLRRVANGETIEITYHGVPVARLAPLSDGGPLEELRAAGEIDRATSDLEDVAAPLPSRAAELPSSLLACLRSDGR